MNYICYKPHTRLGNWLFQIAFARTLGNAPLAFFANPGTPFLLLEKFHELFPDIAFTHELPEQTLTFDDIDLARNGFHLPVQRDNLFLKGYFQCPQLLNQTNIARNFTCPQRIRKIIAEKYGQLLNQPEVIGVSVRRGDYLKIPHRLPFVGEQYLRSAVLRFSTKSVFLVCSDDLPWCRRFFSSRAFLGRNFVFAEGEEVLTQLYLQSFCHHNILSNSTFSWWGGVFEHPPRPSCRVPLDVGWARRQRPTNAALFCRCGNH